jgi:quinoprotein glucose dehydrogenase
MLVFPTSTSTVAASPLGQEEPHCYTRRARLPFDAPICEKPKVTTRTQQQAPLHVSAWLSTLAASWCGIGLVWQSAALAQNAATAPSAMGEVTELTRAQAAEAAAGTEEAQDTRVLDGLELEVWAPPGLVANPLTLDLDSDGRAFVIASARSGLLLDIRQHPNWVPEVHALRSTEDLRQFFRREMAPELSDENQWLPDYNEDGSHDYRDLTVVTERVYRVDDTDGDGVADRSTVVHEGFNEDIASDIAGGILLYGDDLYVTAAPDLWRLSDSTGDGLYDQKVSVSHGYSVHPAFAGHDLSALARGPDGRIYWKIGDIGLNVVDDSGRRWEYPNTGAVLRSEPDGSGFEVFAWGLRNTQEITFDKHGNLISVDNDGDHAGETERVVYIVQGSDAGWRSTWQYGKYTDPKNNRYNVWMEESLYRPEFDGQAAYITPPIAPHHSGPSGVDYNPGTALSERWRDHFFVTSFTGGAANASVYAFELEPDGAGFTLASDTQIVRGLLSAGSAFGPDGALYLTDWVRGWGATGEGQLWRLDVPGEASSELRREVAALLGSDFGRLSGPELALLLAHADMRIRQTAQFALVARADDDTLRDVAAPSSDQLARIHGLWGLGQLARRDASLANDIRELLGDSDPEIRAQAAKMLGDARDARSRDALIAALTDAAPRVRFFAAEALGRIGAPAAIKPIVDMLAANDNDDVYLRTAGIHALASIGDGEALAALAAHASPAVRIAAVVALRRLDDPGAAAFVTDADPLVVTEAARAINDEGGIGPALPALAQALEGPVRDEAFVRRAISANLRVGDDTAAARIGAFAGDPAEDTEMRLEAIAVLGVWLAPSTLDRVDGAWLGQLDSRGAEGARLAAASLLPLLDNDSTSPELKVAVLDSAAALELDAARAFALARLQQDSAADVRIAALRALSTLGGAEAERAIGLALDDSDPGIRMAAVEAIPTMAVAPAVSVRELRRLIGSEAVSIGERRSAIEALGKIEANAATSLLSDLLDELFDGEIPVALELDILASASARANAQLTAQLESAGLGGALENLAALRPTAYEQGGSAQRGRRIALEHPAAQCVRCHIIGDGESSVGPNLNAVGSRLSRAALVESLLYPGATMAEGFGEASGASAMPPMDLLLTPLQIRDVVEFLANER